MRNKKIIYINYVDMENCLSGSSVRPAIMYNTFCESGYEVEMITGLVHKHNIRERKKYLVEKLSVIMKNDYDYCYIEPMTTALFKGYNHFEYDFIKKIHKKGIPIGLFYRDVYWKFRKEFDLKGVRQAVLAFFQRCDVRFYKKYVDCIFIPSKKMNDYIGFENVVPLPPGCKNMGFEVKNTLTNTLIYVGGISYAYGTDMLIEAMRKVNKTKATKLILACRKDELIYLTPFLKDEDLNWLEIHHVKGKELENLYARADAALCPHRRNDYHDFCMPVKLFEYISFLKPVVSTNSIEMAELISKNKLGIVCSDNSDALADAILKMFSDTLQFRNFQEAEKTYSSENTWAKRVEKIAQCLLQH